VLLLSHAVVEATQGTAANESHPSQNAKKQTFLNAEAGERVLLGLTRRGAAMLAVILAGARPGRGTCPVATVAISGDETGDQFIGSPEVKTPVG